MFNAGRLLQYGPLGLFLVAFFESTVFPVPPDVILMPLAMMSPRLSWWYASLTTAASVLGALAGYFVGRKAGRPVLRQFFSEEVIKQVEVLFGRYGGWAVGIAAFTPVPYKVFTFGAGIFGVPLFTFTAVSVFGRGARFFLEGAMVCFLGERAQTYLGANFEITTLALTAVLLLATWLVPKMLPSGRRAAVGERRVRVLREVRSLGAGFLVWAVLAAAAAVFALAFMEDVAGPEREILRGTVAPLFDSMPLARALPGFWSIAGSAWVVSLLSLGGIAAYMRRQSLPASARYRQFAWLLLVGAGAYAVERGTAQYLSLYGDGLSVAGTFLLAPYLSVTGVFLLAWRRSRAWRTASLAAGAALAIGEASHAAAAGMLDPLVAATSLIVSGFAFCATMAVLEALSVRGKPA